MYLRHLATSTFDQHFCNPSISSSLVLGSILHLTYSLTSCHRFSIGFKSGDCAGVFHQIMPSWSIHSRANLDVCLGSLVLLHKQDILTTVNQRLQTLKMLTYPSPSHHSIKNNYACSSTSANASPYMHLSRVLGPGFWSGLLSLLSTAEPPVSFQLETGLVGPKEHS